MGAKRRPPLPPCRAIIGETDECGKPARHAYPVTAGWVEAYAVLCDEHAPDYKPDAGWDKDGPF